LQVVVGPVLILRILLLVSFSYAAIPMDEDSAGEGQNNCHH